jgi:UDP-N-acetylmuramate dehydrogenase
VKEARKVLERELEDSLKVVEPLAKHTQLGIGGPGDFFFEAKTSDDLIRAVEAAKHAKIPFFILGAGSGVIISDVGYHGLVILNLFEGIKEIATDVQRRVQVEVGSGTSLAKLVRYTIENNFSGLEGLAGLPGSIGGAVVFNSGTNGERIENSLDSVRTIDIVGQTRSVPKGECQFGYTSSRFLGREEVVISAKFNLTRSDAGTVGQGVTQAMARLADKPKEPHTLQLFKYLSGESPEKFISLVGLAGYEVGGAKIMESNSNFIQNLGHATAENVVEIVRLAKAKVKEKYYTELQEAFLYIGPF